MKTLAAALVPLALLAGACRTGDAPPAAEPPTAAPSAGAPNPCPADPADVTVRGAIDDGWTVEAVACLGSGRATGSASVPPGPRPDGGPAFSLARARAWATLSRDLRGAARPDDALAATRRALAILGDAYAPPQRVDDTALKLAAAQERLQAGRVDDALGAMARVVDDRLGMFAESRGLR